MQDTLEYNGIQIHIVTKTVWVLLAWCKKIQLKNYVIGITRTADCDILYFYNALKLPFTYFFSHFPLNMKMDSKVTHRNCCCLKLINWSQRHEVTYIINSVNNIPKAILFTELKIIFYQLSSSHSLNLQDLLCLV